jgi:hypothetical protein
VVGGEVAVIRLVVGDAALSERLARSYEPVVSMMIARLAPRSGPSPEVSLKPENGDVVARIQLPAGMLDALAARVGSQRVASVPARCSFADVVALMANGSHSAVERIALPLDRGRGRGVTCRPS